jgi:flagellar biosynthesis protein FlhF
VKVKTFHALTMQDAIRSIKAELGPDAVILSSKEVRHGGRLMSYFNKPVLEVMAAAEDDPLPALSSFQPPESAPIAKKPEPKPAEPPAVKVQAQAQAPAPVPELQPVAKEAFRATLQSLLATPPPSPAPVPASVSVARPVPESVLGVRPSSEAEPSVGPVARSSAAVVARPATADQPVRASSWKQARVQALRRELRALSQQLSASLPVEVQSLGVHKNPEMATLCRNLVMQGLRPSTADRLGHELAAEGKPEARQSLEEQQAALAALIAKDIRVSGPLLAGAGDRAIAIMMGTSGVGKTTSLTKLAAHYRLEEKKSVAIITFDTYRPASVEHVRMYAKVLGIPFASATSAKQAAEGVRRQAHTDVVLIDTAGFGESDVALVHDLHRALRDEPEVQTHLVLSAATREQDLQRQLAKVNDLPLLRLLFTKLDETEAFGALYDLAYHAGIPLSYWSAGQRVPEDLEMASPQRLAEFLIRRRYRVAEPPSVDEDQVTLLSSTTMDSDMTRLVKG